MVGLLTAKSASFLPYTDVSPPTRGGRGATVKCMAKLALSPHRVKLTRAPGRRETRTDGRLSTPRGSALERRRGGADPLLDVPHLRFVSVGMAGPEEPLHAVLVAARDHVHVQVRHALADLVVDRDEAAVGL